MVQGYDSKLEFGNITNLTQPGSLIQIGESFYKVPESGKIGLRQIKDLRSQGISHIKKIRSLGRNLKNSNH
jgi:hypothetical protein